MMATKPDEGGNNRIRRRRFIRRYGEMRNMIYEDWFMRQIQMLIQFVSRLVFGKDFIEYELNDRVHQTAADLIHSKLLRLLAQNEFGAAEDTLFANFCPDQKEHLKLALDFYQRLSQISDDVLEAHNFPREEIADGLYAIIRRSKIDPYGLLK